jgi:hypothetical protein
MSADPHASHGTAVADPHGHDSHGHDAHGQDAHGHGSGGHGSAGHDEAPRQTPVPPHEATPWSMILLGVVIVGGIIGLGIARDWKTWVQANPKGTLSAPGQPAK